jgi:hypothetical protein
MPEKWGKCDLIKEGCGRDKAIFGGVTGWDNTNPFRSMSGGNGLICGMPIAIHREFSFRGSIRHSAILPFRHSAGLGRSSRTVLDCLI